MADKMRSINTRFWDDPYIEELTVSEKLLFLYLLTNSLTNLLGIYEITVRRIAYETGLNKEIISKGFERFATARKVFYTENYIIMPNFLKNQNLNANMKKGVVNLYNNLPSSLKDSIKGNGSEGFESIRNALGKYEIEIEDEIEDEIETKENIEFDSFWNLYDKKIDKIKCESKWNRLSNSEHEKIMDYLPAYILSTPDKKFRKNPETFFNSKSWENEIVSQSVKSVTQRKDSSYD